MPSSFSELGRQVMLRAFAIAGATDEQCRPIHVLAALGDTDSPVSAALAPTHGHGLVPASPSAARRGSHASFELLQTQGAAIRFASERGETVGAEHLLLAVLDQGDPEVLESVRLAGLDSTALRRATLEALGAPEDLPPLAMPALTPAGTAGRPPLPLEQLDARAWSVLTWRQEHLPLDKVRRTGHAEALCRLETRAVWRVSDKLELDDDQRHSLLTHHLERVKQRIAAARPQTMQLSEEPHHDLATTGAVRRRRRLYRHSWLRVTAGWGTWFGNRRVGVRNGWFKVRTLGHFRHAPQF